MASFPSLQLTYFDIPGRAEAIRKTLSLGGVPFVDERVSYAEFLKRKPSFPFGKMPALTIDGVVYAETQGLLRYAARLAGLYPPVSEPVAALLVDEMLSMFEDFFDRLLQPSFDEKDPAVVKQMREHALAGPLPLALRRIDARLQQIAQHAFFANHKSDVFVHEVLVYDYVVFLRSGQLEHIPTTLVDEYKTMVAVYDKVVKHTTVQQPHGTQAGGSVPPRLQGELTLSYFDCVGRGEHIRLALWIGGIDFQDERLSREAFEQRKLLFPNEEVPVISLDGRIVGAQSFAILRYIGRVTGMYPTDDLITALKIDEVIGHATELDTILWRGMHEQDETKKRENFATILKVTIPEFLQSLDARVQQWKGDSKSLFALGGASMTIADLAIYNLLLDLKTSILDDEDLAPYEQLLNAYKAVENHPRVVEWYAKMS